MCAPGVAIIGSHNSKAEPSLPLKSALVDTHLVLSTQSGDDISFGMILTRSQGHLPDSCRHALAILDSYQPDFVLHVQETLLPKTPDASLADVCSLLLSS